MNDHTICAWLLTGAALTEQVTKGKSEPTSLQSAKAQKAGEHVLLLYIFTILLTYINISVFFKVH